MLTHYIIVRRDLPLGVLAAMITHAAGESGALYQDIYDGRFRDAAAVVLEAKNEDDLYAIERRLRLHNFRYVAVTESDGKYSGHFMAIGLVPDHRESFGDVLKHYLTLKELDKPKDSE